MNGTENNNKFFVYIFYKFNIQFLNIIKFFFEMNNPKT